MEFIQVGFGYVLGWLYELTRNYGVALILFTVVLKLVLLYPTMRSKRSTMKMSRLTPQIQFIQKKYANDRQKQAEMTQALYKAEGVSMGGGCLWSLVPLLLLFPLYAVVRQPIVYVFHETLDTAGKIMNVIKEALPDLVSQRNAYYEQMIAAPLLPQFADKIEGIVSNPATLDGLKFTFFGVDLAAVPNFNFGSWGSDLWANIGLFLLPILSAGSQVLTMLVSQKMNNSLVTNEKGVQDKEAAKNSDSAKTSKTMMYIMPLMSLWIGFTIPGAMSVYWLAQGLLGMFVDMALTKHYRKKYDAEDASKLRLAMEEEERQMEKERIRAERRAANPEGITQNTSKKKLQENKRKEQEAEKAAAAREYAEKRGIVFEEEKENLPLSGVKDRPFCKGRAYDPDRYTKTEEE
jgi:YidC/Oxa1 family membrane protein insertase